MRRSRFFVVLLVFLALACQARDESAPPVDLGSGLSPSSAPSPDVPLADLPVSSRLRIIESTLTLRVDDCRETITSISQAVSNDDGFVESSQEHHEGCPTQIVARIPSTRLEEFMGAVRSIGTLSEAQQRITDVSAPRADLAARLRNERAHEARLLAMMSEHAETLDDLLRVSEQLRVVRESIERMEAQARTLDEQTTYARVEIKLENIPNIVTTETPRTLDLLKEAGVAGVAFARSLLVGIARVILFVGPAAILMTALWAAIYVVWKALRKAFAH
jgi:hypothetical protein